MVIPEEHQSRSDEELVALTLQDPDYYTCLIDRYEKKLARYLRRISSFSEDDIEDVLQVVFIKAYKNLNDFDRRLKFSSWLYRIAHNELISQHRRRLARPQSVIAIDDVKVINKFAAEVDLVGQADNKFLAQRMGQALGQINHKYREVLILKFWEDKSYEEISNILKKPIGTVGTLIRRAKGSLKRELAKKPI